MKFIFSLLFMVIILNSYLVYSENNKDKLLDELLVKSGIKDQTKEYGKIILESFKKAYEVKSPELFSAISKKTKNIYSADKFIKETKFEWENNLNIKDIKKILKWLNSSVGIKMTELEKKYSKLDKFEQLDRLASKMSFSNIRIKVLNRMDEVLGASELSADIAINVAMAVSYGISTIQNGNNTGVLQQIEKMLEYQRPQIEKQMKKHTLLSFLYIYRTLSIEELKKFIEFSETKIGKKYSNLGAKALNKIFSKGAIEIGKCFSKLKKNQK